MRHYGDVKVQVRALAVLVALTAALPAQTTAGWRPIRSDEFTGTAGSPPDPSKWNYDLGRWLGQQPTHSRTGHGDLVIHAIRDSSGNYIWARLQTGTSGASYPTSDGKLARSSQ